MPKQLMERQFWKEEGMQRRCSRFGRGSGWEKVQGGALWLILLKVLRDSQERETTGTHLDRLLLFSQPLSLPFGS